MVESDPIETLPGFGPSHAAHIDASSLFSVVQMSHFHTSFLTKCARLPMMADFGGSCCFGAAPGFGPSHAAHIDASSLFSVEQMSHFQTSFLTKCARLPMMADFGGSCCFGAAAGFGPSHAAHIDASSLFSVVQMSHFHTSFFTK